MLKFLHIEYLDGHTHVEGVSDDFASVKVKDGHLFAFGGDGSYQTRGDVKAWPTHNIRRWWVSDERSN